MEFWYLAAGFVAGIIVGVRLSKIFHKHVIKEIIKDCGLTNDEVARLLSKMDQQPSSDDLPRVEITLEQHGEVFYAYREDTGEFLAQAEDFDALLVLIKDRLGNCTVLFDKDAVAKVPGYRQL